MFSAFTPTRLRIGTTALLTSAAVAAPAAPALAAPADVAAGDSYRVEAASLAPAELDGRELPDGADLDRTTVQVAPDITTASAPGAWLAGGTEEFSLTHTVQDGETLGDIAAAYGLEDRAGWRVLFDANDAVTRHEHIWPGLELTVPLDGEELERRALPEPPAPEPEPERRERQVASRGGERSSAEAPSDAAPAEPADAAVSGGRWDQLAACESGGNWAINTGNGYYGGLQFSLQSWRAVGGSGYPHQASKAEQIRRAEILQSQQGWGAWPACTAKLGWR